MIGTKYHILCDIYIFFFFVFQNFYLIDPYLVGFITTVLGRRLVYCALSRVLLSWSPVSLRPVLQQLLR
jgi:Putative transmembrane protein.